MKKQSCLRPYSRDIPPKESVSQLCVLEILVTGTDTLNKYPMFHIMGIYFSLASCLLGGVFFGREVCSAFLTLLGTWADGGPSIFYVWLQGHPGRLHRWGKKAFLFLNHSGSEVAPDVSAHIPMLGASLMVHFKARGAGKHSPRLGSHFSERSLHP